MQDKIESLTLPVLITRGLVVYPNNPQMIDAGRSFTINAFKASRSGANSLIIVTAQINPDIETPDFDSIHKFGTLCRITSASDRPDGIKIRIEPLERVEITALTKNDGYFVAQAHVNNVSEPDETTNQVILDMLTNELEKMPSVVRSFPRNIGNALTKTDKAISLCFMLAANISLSTDRKQEVLESKDAVELAQRVLAILNGEKEKDEIEERIQATIRESAEKSQKEYFLREKLKAVKKELGDQTDDSHDPDNIRERLEKEPFPENIKTKIKNELKKYEMMPNGSLEAALIQNYIDTLLAIPWYQKTEDCDDLSHVEKILDEDHYGLEQAKKRIIEYLAVKKLTGNLKSPILCFYGPPGCGKTSLGKSIARALGRKFFKASLGGISDEAEIRGHRRTYVGSMPGRIISGMKKAGVVNPVFLLDEIDKLASSYKGDPASAMLEVLDPEQNTAFNDNYVEEPYDLSDVLFVCTANYLENIPGPLRDRLELIEIPSYTELEKVQIAKGHLVSKQIELNGLKKEQVEFTDSAITYIIRRYTREAGVRELERKIAACLRKVAVAIVKDPSIKSIVIDNDKVREYLEKEIFDDSKKETKAQIGVVTGLAYTSYGGDILPIEVNYFKGRGQLVLTGHLGDVMKESCSIALDYVRANAERYGIEATLFSENDIHIHVPEGAVPKDGPSAGVAITTAIISCLTKTPVDSNVAMTGEVTLRGHALPIGGLREKSLAALRSGIKTIVVPKANEKDVKDLPNEVKKKLKIKFMERVDDALEVALIKN
ncbi:MAG: endopeptidase La [Bacilli bacterium]|nr:endopeptidase La [Bacilli bacterium]